MIIYRARVTNVVKHEKTYSVTAVEGKNLNIWVTDNPPSIGSLVNICISDSRDDPPRKNLEVKESK